MNKQIFQSATDPMDLLADSYKGNLGLSESLSENFSSKNLVRVESKLNMNLTHES